MRASVSSILILGLFFLFGCPAARSSGGWTTGFWIWSADDVEPYSQPVDVLFFHVGSGDWILPEELPSARAYWPVWRYESPGVPALSEVPGLTAEFVKVAAAARARRLPMPGLQLDIDSPTAALPDYARFIRELRKNLPAGTEVSITALLDWFRDGTAIRDVIRETDEFVPQFYDVENRDRYDGGAAIAARVDAARWGPRFRRFGKRFRIGISTFGRSLLVARTRSVGNGSSAIRFFHDLTPMDVAARPEFQLQADRNRAGELVLRYRAARKVKLGYNEIEAGDTVQFVLASPESVRGAVESAKQMGGAVAGVVFFRWPVWNESLTMQPAEALAAAGVAGADGGARQDRVQAIDGRCAAVTCVDLHLESAKPLSPDAIRYRIRASTAMEYFVPAGSVPVRMAGPAQLEVTLPPYCGRARLYLGRAVSRKRATFDVQEEK